MGHFRWLILLGALAQVSIPRAPTNLRFVDGTSACPGGQLGTVPICFPPPPVAATAGKQWRVTYAEEFNGTSLDTTKLTPCFDWNYGACQTPPPT